MGSCSVIGLFLSQLQWPCLVVIHARVTSGGDSSLGLFWWQEYAVSLFRLLIPFVLYLFQFSTLLLYVFHFFPTLDILELSLGHLAAHVFLDYALESGPLETGAAQEMDARCFGCSGDSTAWELENRGEQASLGFSLHVSGMNYNPQMEDTPVRDFFAWFEAGKFTSSLDLWGRKT